MDFIRLDAKEGLGTQPMSEQRGRGGTRGGGADRDPEDELARALQQFHETLRERMAGFEPASNEFELSEIFAWLRHSAGALGMRSRPSEIDDFGMDSAALSRAGRFLDFLADRYWRIETRRADALPAPALFVANRGGLLPYDGLMLAHVLARKNPGQPRPRFLWTDGVESLPFVTPWLTRLGAVRAGRENAERLLRSGRSVIAFPEGASASQKSFADRYRLQSFGRGGIVRVALETGAPVVPVGIVGAEEVHPLIGRAPFAAAATGLPFLPVTPDVSPAGGRGAPASSGPLGHHFRRAPRLDRDGNPCCRRPPVVGANYGGFAAARGSPGSRGNRGSNPAVRRMSPSEGPPYRR